jgi:hypothetical protein
MEPLSHILTLRFNGSGDLARECYCAACTLSYGDLIWRHIIRAETP